MSSRYTSQFTGAQIDAHLSDVDVIKGKIPNEASSSNQLADKAFVGTSIATATATFRGTVTASDNSESAAQTALATITTKDNNDYANVEVQNYPQAGVNYYKRYTYNGSAWTFNYAFNTTGFTAAQWAALNSGATAEAIAAIAGKYVKPADGIPSTDLASAVQTSLGKADTALQQANVKQTTGQSTADVMSQKATTDLVAGLKSDLESGNEIPALAQNLHTEDTTENSMFDGGDQTSEERESDNFILRSAGGNMSIGQAASVKSLQGRTVGWNQLQPIKATSITETQNGVTLTDNRDGSYTINGTATADANFFGLYNTTIPKVVGHKYLCVGGYRQNDIWPYGLYAFWYIGGITETNGIVTITNANQADLYFYWSVPNGTVCNSVVVRPQLFDLTQMFGDDAAICEALGVANLSTDANKAIAIANFERMFPAPYYAYDAGSLKSFNPDALKATGYNLYKPSNVIAGYGITNGVITADASKKIAYAKVPKTRIGSTENNGYLIETAGSKVAKVGFSQSLPVAGGSVTNVASVSGTHIAYTDNTAEGYIVIECTNNDDICLHFKWSGDKPDHYEAYTENSAAIDVSAIKDGQGNTVFPNGLLSAGSKRDEIKDGKWIKRIGTVDLGALEWTLRYDGTAHAEMTSTGLNSLIPTTWTATNRVNNIVCSKYSSASTDAVYMHASNKIIACMYGDEYLSVYDSSYITDAAAFKAAMNGVYAYYELATPITGDLPADWKPNYMPNDYGLEEYVGAQVPMIMPYAASIEYERDLKGEIRNHIDRHSDEWASKGDLNDYAQKDEICPDLVAGNLIDMKATGDTQSFAKVRTSCGDASIADDGYAIIRQVDGNAIVWNQQNSNQNLENAGSGYVKSQAEVKNSVAWNQQGKEFNATNWAGDTGTTQTFDTANNKVTFTVNSAYYGIHTSYNVNIIAGHKYLFAYDVFVETAGSYILLRSGGLTISSGQIEANTWTRKEFIQTATGSQNANIIMGDSRSSEWTPIGLKNLMLIDLTAIFGAGREPSTVAEFKAIAATWGKNIDTYQPYNDGTTPTAIPDAMVMKTNTGTAEVTKIKGNSLGWNQLAKPFTTIDGTFVYGRCTISNNTERGCTFTANDGIQSGWYCMQSLPLSISGHTYYYRISEKGTANLSFALDNLYAHEIEFNENDEVWRTKESINVANISQRFALKGSTTGYAQIKDLVIFDLTQMFGAGNEPSTVEQFRALFPLDYYAYNAGGILDTNFVPAAGSTPQSRVESEGANVCDEAWSQGLLNDNDGTLNPSITQAISSTNFNSCLPNATYYGYVDDSDSKHYFEGYFYDANKNYLGSSAKLTVKNRTFTTPTNAYYFKIRFYNATGDVTPSGAKSICINLSDANINGTYRPYAKSTLNLPLNTGGTTLTLRKAGSVYDEVVGNKVTRRVGVVDMGSLRWVKNADFIFITQDNELWASGRNILCVPYTTNNPFFQDWNNMPNDTIQCHAGFLIVKVSASYTDAAAFKTAMSGVMLNYELATPVTETIPDWVNTYQYEAEGSETFLPAANESAPSSAPLVASVKYDINFNSTDESTFYRRSIKDGTNVAAAISSTIRGVSLPADLISGHYYMVRAEVKATASTIGLSCGNNTLISGATHTGNGTWQTLAGVVQAGNNQNGFRVINTNPSNTSIFFVKNFCCFDLTKLNLTTRAGFFKHYSFDIAPYNGGEVIPTRVEEIDTVGFQQWDEEWEVGTINLSNGQNTTSSTAIRSKNYIPVFPNTTYYVKLGATNGSPFRLCYYDANKNFVSSVNEAINTTKVVPAGCYYLRFATYSTYGNTYNHDICINLAWSGYRNGEYEAYWKNALDPKIKQNLTPAEYDPSKTYALKSVCMHDGSMYACSTAITTAEAWNAAHWTCIRQGYAAYDATKVYVVGNKCKHTNASNVMKVYVCNTAITTAEAWNAAHWTETNEDICPAAGALFSAGSVKDYYDSTKAIIRIGCVDLGTLNWTFQGVVSGVNLMITSLSTSKSISSNVICGKYISGSWGIDKSIQIINSVIYLNDSSSTSAASFKTAMQGVMLYYELATPIEVAHDEVNLKYKVADFGTEEAKPENGATPTTAPFTAVIAYSDDFTRQLATMKKNYQSQLSMDSLLTVLGTACGGTFAKTWDDTNNKWTYSFTPNP